MDERDWLAQRFEEQRPHLRAVAYRLLGSPSEADDAVQESWLRLSRTDTSGIENLGGWLTTVVGRVCLDMLRTRKSRREEPLEFPSPQGEQSARIPEPIVSREDRGNPEDEALMADSVGLALLVVLDTLNPAERLAFVLHDIFDVSFDEIAPIVGRTPTAARQLASRARRRVQGQGQVLDQEQEEAAATDTAIPATDLSRQREVVDAFLAAARGGDFAALLALLDPEVMYRADQAVEAIGEPRELHGAAAVAQQFAGRAKGAQPALINGAVGFAWAPGGEPRAVFSLTIADGKIVAIDLVTDPERLHQLNVAILGD